MSVQTPSSNRFVTGHDEQGNSIFLYEGPTALFETSRDGQTTVHGMPWSTDEPLNLSDDRDTQEVEFSTIHSGTGTTVRFLTFPPHSKGFMHRTATLDYVVIQKGELVLELAGGGERVCKEGDIIVQRGTDHAWHNRTDQTAQFLAVLITAELPEIKGQKLVANAK